MCVCYQVFILFFLLRSSDDGVRRELDIIYFIVIFYLEQLQVRLWRVVHLVSSCFNLFLREKFHIEFLGLNIFAY